MLKFIAFIILAVVLFFVFRIVVGIAASFIPFFLGLLALFMALWVAYKMVSK